MRRKCDSCPVFQSKQLFVRQLKYSHRPKIKLQICEYHLRDDNHIYSFYRNFFWLIAYFIDEIASSKFSLSPRSREVRTVGRARDILMMPTKPFRQQKHRFCPMKNDKKVRR